MGMGASTIEKGNERRVHADLRKALDSVWASLKTHEGELVRFNYRLQGGMLVGVGRWMKREAQPDPELRKWLETLAPEVFEREVYLLEKDDRLSFRNRHLDMQAFIRLKREQPMLADIFCACNPELFGNRCGSDLATTVDALANKYWLKPHVVSLMLEAAEDLILTDY